MICLVKGNSKEQIDKRCASGSVVEYRLAKARVAGSNPVSRLEKDDSLVIIFFLVTIQPDG